MRFWRKLVDSVVESTGTLQAMGNQQNSLDEERGAVAQQGVSWGLISRFTQTHRPTAGIHWLTFSLISLYVTA